MKNTTFSNIDNNELSGTRFSGGIHPALLLYDCVPIQNVMSWTGLY